MKDRKKTILTSPVMVMGCSDSRDIELAYRNVSLSPVTFSAARSGGTIKAWGQNLTGPAGIPYWDYFDEQFQEGTTAVWWPICEHAGDHLTKNAAWTDFVAAYNRLRERTNAQLYVTDTIGAPLTCLIRRLWMADIAAQAVEDGYAIRSSPDIPMCSDPIDECHFNPNNEADIGNAALTFLEGE